jgi:hypothetical protein
MPPELEVTVPVPIPVLATVSVYWLSVKVAATVVADVTLTTQVVVPEHPPPDQAVNVDPAAGVAVNVTEAPEL